MTYVTSMSRLYPMADSLQMTLTMVNQCEFGGQMQIILDRWLENYSKSVTVKIGKSHYDHSSGNAWCVVPIMGNLALVLLSDNGKRMMYAYVVAEDKVDQASLADMIRKDVWSRKTLLGAINKALVAVYIRRWEEKPGVRWAKKLTGVEEVQAYNALRDAGFGSGDADRLASDIATGQTTLAEAMLVSKNLGAAQARPKSSHAKKEIAAISNLLGTSTEH